MANPEAGTSGDVAPASGCEYQVFLNFRGFDTRHGFTDFLYNHLIDVGIRVFRDDDELKIGEVIGENLVSAINNSIIYIPIFSKNYASSKWCLLELAHIVNNVSNSKDEKSIIPIFFNVKSDDVKLKTSVYSNALSEHERKSPDQVKVWKEALAKVGEIKEATWKRTQGMEQCNILFIVDDVVHEGDVGCDLVPSLDVQALESHKVEEGGLGGAIHLDNGERQEPSGKGDVLETAGRGLLELDPGLIELGGRQDYLLGLYSGLKPHIFRLVSDLLGVHQQALLKTSTACRHLPMPILVIRMLGEQNLRRAC
ncbi:TMV resistance protein N-like [Eucalyptus grandis]|uniref:TMV resistance protein N-like n=1 Tax=Eucalyptus grandis TaxID=71139 RepID=UPI00192E87F8|nr:TMV resistance protein N-like [Eucalyptus grandis]